MIKCIFFDIGGTLCKSPDREDGKLSFKKTLAHYTNKPTKHFSIEKQPYLWTKPGPKKELIIQLCKDLGIKDHQRLQDKLSGFSYKVKLYDDVRPGLKKLCSKFELGILSNTTIWTAKDATELGLKGYIKYNVLSCKVGAAKPDTQIYQYAEKITGFKPSELLYIGDTIEFDINPALEAGWKSILMCRKRRRRGVPVPTISKLDELEKAMLLI